MESDIKNKKFKSIVNKVVSFPLMIMALFLAVAVVCVALAFVNVEKKLIDGNSNSIQIVKNQLDYELTQLDKSLWQFVDSNEDNRVLFSFKECASTNDYMLYLVGVQNWIDSYVDLHKSIQGFMIYYSNIDTIVFRGTSNFEMHEYLRDKIYEELPQYNKWRVQEINGRYYLINIYKYSKLELAAWIPVTSLENEYKLTDSAYLGDVYFFDESSNNTLADEEKRQYVSSESAKSDHLGISKYENITARDSDNKIGVGILIPRSSIIKSIPKEVYLVVLLLVFTVIFVPLIVSWLRNKIAYPLKAIDEAMIAIGEGDLDKRIVVERQRTYDELDRLMDRFNEMMDDINDLENNVYKLTIQEQQTKLKYISQQIRPHFILNALNIIYTYKDDEMDRVKEMVLHLTDYFRYIVNLKEDMIELYKEMDHIENYLYIQKERYDKRFDFYIEWNEGISDFQIPPVIIQTFVENSIKHARIRNSQLYIYVLAGVENERVKIMMADTGEGFSDEVLKKLSTFLESRVHQDGLGVGIENAIERLDFLYADKAEIVFRNADSGGAVVEIYLPIDLRDYSGNMLADIHQDDSSLWDLNDENAEISIGELDFDALNLDNLDLENINLDDFDIDGIDINNLRS